MSMCCFSVRSSRCVSVCCAGYSLTSVYMLNYIDSGGHHGGDTCSTHFLHYIWQQHCTRLVDVECPPKRKLNRTPTKKEQPMKSDQLVNYLEISLVLCCCCSFLVGFAADQVHKHDHIVDQLHVVQLLQQHWGNPISHLILMSIAFLFEIKMKKLSRSTTTSSTTRFFCARCGCFPCWSCRWKISSSTSIEKKNIDLDDLCICWYSFAW